MWSSGPKTRGRVGEYHHRRLDCHSLVSAAVAVSIGADCHHSQAAQIIGHSYTNFGISRFVRCDRAEEDAYRLKTPCIIGACASFSVLCLRAASHREGVVEVAVVEVDDVG